MDLGIRRVMTDRFVEGRRGIRRDQRNSHKTILIHWTVPRVGKGMTGLRATQEDVRWPRAARDGRVPATSIGKSLLPRVQHAHRGNVRAPQHAGCLTIRHSVPPHAVTSESGRRGNSSGGDPVSLSRGRRRYTGRSG